MKGEFVLTKLELWAKFINAEKQEEFAMIAEKDPYIQSAYNQLQIISQDKHKRLEYEARQKAILDHNQSILEAEQRGREEGIKEGIEKGIKEGIKEGIEEGIKKGIKEGIEEGRELEAASIALRLIALGMDDAAIIGATSLSPEKVKALRKKL